MTLPTKGCTCAHLGPEIHDPTNPHCAIFSGAALRLDDGPEDDYINEPGMPTEPDDEGLQPPRTSPVAEAPEFTPAPPPVLAHHAFQNISNHLGPCTFPGCTRSRSDLVHNFVFNDPPPNLPWPNPRDVGAVWHQGTPRVEPIPEFAESLNTQIAMPSLVVNVDFNDLYEIRGEEKTWEILGKLKDLLS
jgi:hypothetical protein